MNRVVALLVLGLVMASCGSMPAQGTAPAWTLQAPRPDASNTYFTGSSTATDAAKAEEDAVNRLIGDIMRYIGVDVSVDSTATARATLDSYQASVLQTVRSTAAGRVSGLRIKDRWAYTDRKAGTTTVYVLASYLTADLEREKARIEAAFREKVDAVARPEAEGLSLAQSGRYPEAARKFVEAAMAASSSDVENAAIKLERNLRNARDALSRLRLVALGSPPPANLGQPWAAPFRARLVAGEGEAAPGVPGAVILVSYQRRQGSRTVSKTEETMSGADGSLSFTPPPPDFTGPAKLVLRVDFQSTIELLDALAGRGSAAAVAANAGLRDALIQELRAKQLEIPYQVLSAARLVPTAVALVDLDEAGAAAGGQAQAALLEALAKERFLAVAAGLDPGLVAAGPDEAVAAAARGILAGKAERLVVGRARIVAVRKEGTSWLAEASASFSAIELATGRLLYTGQKSATGIGADEAGARKAAWRELGLNAIGKELLASLP
jgi:hypothetical protein